MQFNFGCILNTSWNPRLGINNRLKNKPQTALSARRSLHASTHCADNMELRIISNLRTRATNATTFGLTAATKRS